MIPSRLPQHPHSRKKPRRQGWLRLTHTVKAHLAPWKIQYMSIGGRLMLTNSVLRTVPIYWMSMFELPKWVIQDFNSIRLDFLRNGKDSIGSKCRLVTWPPICKMEDQGGLGLQHLQDFNHTFLGKRW